MSPNPSPDPWFLCPEPRPAARMTLFCLPFAGGGASAYHAWSKALPESLEVRAVQLPGHETRLREPLATDMLDLADRLADAMLPYLDRPYAMFGYSLGATLGFEVARGLRHRAEREPSCLFVASRKAPHLPNPHPRIAHLPRPEFLDQIRHYYEPSEAAWEIPELMDMLLPVLRADVGMCDDYAYIDDAPLGCPIHAFVGDRDLGAPVTGVAEWRRQTAAEFSLQTHPGAHFFINETQAQRQIHGTVTEVLGDLMATAG